MPVASRHEEGDVAMVTAEHGADTRTELPVGWKHLWIPFLGVLALILGSPLLLHYEPLKVPWGLWLATILAAVPAVTFFGLFAATRDVRSAIAASFVMLYFTVLAHLLLAGNMARISRHWIWELSPVDVYNDGHDCLGVLHWR